MTNMKIDKYACFDFQENDVKFRWEAHPLKKSSSTTSVDSEKLSWKYYKNLQMIYIDSDFYSRC